MLSARAYSLSVLASTGERFVDFAPYVPSIADDGAVAFQARLRSGGSGVYVARAGEAEPLIEPNGMVADVVSHPDINGVGACCFYAHTDHDVPAVFSIESGNLTKIAPAAGPLGPTMNSAGSIAFRAPTSSGGEGIFRAHGPAITTIAETGPLYKAFHGLPVIDHRARVFFSADLVSGGQSLVLGDGQSHQTIAATGELFSALGSFPAMNDSGLAVFAASLRAGGSGIFAAAEGRIDTLIDSHSPFESFRGALADGRARVVFYATPRAGALGIFRGPDPAADRILSIDDELCGSTVTEFALNPVSINSAGQLALRVRLANNRQLIMRADPARDDSRPVH